LIIRVILFLAFFEKSHLADRKGVQIT